MDIWSKIKELFNEAEESSPIKPLIHELITRSESEKEDYDFWKKTLVCRRLVDWLNSQYAIYQVLPKDTDEAIDFLNHPSSKGFVIHFHKTQYSTRDASHLLDYLKEQVATLDYKIQISDRREYNRPNWVERVEKHYLKPRPNFSEKTKFNQGFGNVLIELVYRNDQVYHLKFSATGYNDSLFKDVKDFKDLMHTVLAVQP